MSRFIDIEYCGSWGYGPLAMHLKRFLERCYPKEKIYCHASQFKTLLVVVAWCRQK